MIAGDALSWLLGRAFVTPFQIDIYKTASAGGWLVMAVAGNCHRNANRRGDHLPRLSISRLA